MPSEASEASKAVDAEPKVAQVIDATPVPSAPAPWLKRLLASASCHGHHQFVALMSPVLERRQVLSTKVLVNFVSLLTLV